jgi:homoaconitase/3-isopropylmalate dehydratase large subunit
VAPASVRDAEAAEREGTLRALLDAGATLLPSACGVCAGYGATIPEGSTVISSTARNFKGRMGAATVRLLVAPASVRDAEAAGREGILRVLLDAGATLLPSACGVCAGYGASIPEGSTVISSTARNFQGRMGAATAQVFLASPYTVAASALRGRIADPRELLA